MSSCSIRGSRSAHSGSSARPCLKRLVDFSDLVICESCVSRLLPLYWCLCLLHFAWKLLRSDRNSISDCWSKTIISLTSDIEVLSPFAPIVPHLIVERVVAGSHEERPKDDDDFQLYPCFNGLPAWWNPWRFGQARVAHARSRETRKDFKQILTFLEKKGHKKDAFDKRLLANRRYEATSRHPGQTLQDFFATGNMAYAYAVKAGVRIDPDRRDITCSFGVASQMTRSITFTVSCAIPKRSDHRQLWILARFKKLHSGFTTNLGIWTDTVTPERLWADIHDL